MDQPQQNPAMPPVRQGQPQGPNASKMMWVIGALALIILLLAWYFMSVRVANAPMTTPPSPTTSATGSSSALSNMDPASIAVGASDTVTQRLNTQGTSDDLSAIQQDLNATDMSALDGINNL